MRLPLPVIVARLAVILAVAAHVIAAHFIVGRGRRARLALALPLALRIHDPVVVLGVLVQILRRDPVAAGLSLARHRDVALEHLIRVAANLDARAVALEGLRAVRRTRPAVVVGHHAAAATTVAAARSILLSWPHDTCLNRDEQRDLLVQGSAIGRVYSSGRSCVCKRVRREAPKREQPSRDGGAFQPFSWLPPERPDGPGLFSLAAVR